MGAGRVGSCSLSARAVARVPYGRSPPVPTATRRRWPGKPSGGRGSLYSWTVVWRPPHPTLVVPYAPAVITLDEGWWFLTAVVGCRPGDLRQGMTLGVEFHAASQSIVLPYFRPVAG